MERPFTTRFGYGAEPSTARKIARGILALPFILPFAIAAGISIPWTKITKLRQLRNERKFLEHMRQAQRIMTWEEFQHTIKSGTGTVIGEYLSTKGPFRLWWTGEDIPAVSPHKWQREQHLAWMEDEFRPFFEWCYARYTNPQSGAARLVVVPEQERKQLRQVLNGPHFVSTCSFLSVREKGTTNTALD